MQAAKGQCQRNESQLCLDSTSAPNTRLPSNPLLHTPAVSHSSWHDAGQYSMECLYSDVRLFFLSIKCSLTHLFLFIRYQMLEHKWFCWSLFISQQCAMLWSTSKHAHTHSICLIESFFPYVLSVLSNSVAILFFVPVGIHATSVSAFDGRNDRLHNTLHIFPLVPLLL